MGEIKIPDYCRDCPIYGNHDCPVIWQEIEIKFGDREEISIENSTLEEKYGSLEHRKTLADLNEINKRLAEGGRELAEEVGDALYFDLNPLTRVPKH